LVGAEGFEPPTLCSQSTVAAVFHDLPSITNVCLTFLQSERYAHIAGWVDSCQLLSFPILTPHTFHHSFRRPLFAASACTGGVEPHWYAVTFATQESLRAERRCGELLADMPKAKGTAGQGNPNWLGSNKVEPPSNQPQTLADLGISKRQSSEWQQLHWNEPETARPAPRRVLDRQTAMDGQPMRLRALNVQVQDCTQRPVCPRRREHRATQGRYSHEGRTPSWGTTS